METPQSLYPLHPDRHSAADVIRVLGLAPLEREGGWFRRTGESDLLLPAESLGGRYRGPRRAYSMILFLFTPEAFSALHRLTSDEIWCFQAGDPLESLRLRDDGSAEWVQLGLNPEAGERVQDIVPARTWQGTRLQAGGRWGLVSCVVVPEFTWEDFELGEREVLSGRHPAIASDIQALTREIPAS